LFLPPEHDPDSFVREHGKDMFEAKLREAWPLSRFLLEELKSHVDMATPEGRARLVHEAKPLLQKIAAPVMQLQMLKEVAHLADMAPEEAAEACGIGWRAAARSSAGSSALAGRGKPGRNQIEQRPYPEKGRLIAARRRDHTYLRYVLLVPSLAEKVPEELLSGESPEGQLLARMVRHIESAEVHVTRDLLEWLRDQPEEELARTLSEEAMGTTFAEDDIRIEFNKALEQIEENRCESRIQELEAKEKREGLSREEAVAYQALIFEKRKLQEQRKAPRPMV
jgi:DNA primase